MGAEVPEAESQDPARGGGTARGTRAPFSLWIAGPCKPDTALRVSDKGPASSQDSVPTGKDPSIIS